MKIDRSLPVPLRSPGEVMTLTRMGAAHPTALSFRRILMRRFERERWQMVRRMWDIDADGVGIAIYTATCGERTYSLVAFAHDIDDDDRTDRVIATAWDATFALYDGIPDAAAIERLRNNVPLQEAGRMSAREITLSRANRSVRLFEHTVGALSEGRQPDPNILSDVGYLMRTTAVYGSGKFGLSDHQALADRPELSPPFQAEMLTVWMIRSFARDIVDHLAHARGGTEAAQLSDDLACRLGIGNSTGLGMAPFLLTHPRLIHAWVAARETALSMARAIERLDQKAVLHLRTLVTAARSEALAWQTSDERQAQRCAALVADLDTLCVKVEEIDGFARPLDRLWTWARDELSIEGQERLSAILIDMLPDDVLDGLVPDMSVDEQDPFPIDADQTVAELASLIAEVYAWSLDTDWTSPAASARLWYTSVEKLEPRLAERALEPLEDYEHPFAPGRDAAALYKALAAWPAEGTIGAFLERYPTFRHTVRRILLVHRHDYAEIRSNTICGTMRPSDMLRFKLAFLGASRFDPRSDRWVRVTFFSGAEYPDRASIGTEICDA